MDSGLSSLESFVSFEGFFIIRGFFYFLVLVLIEEILFKVETHVCLLTPVLPLDVMYLLFKLLHILLLAFLKVCVCQFFLQEKELDILTLTRKAGALNLYTFISTSYSAS